MSRLALMPHTTEEICQIAEQTRVGISKLASRAALIEAAMRVLIKHNLLEEFAAELANPTDIEEFARSQERST